MTLITGTAGLRSGAVYPLSEFEFTPRNRAVVVQDAMIVPPGTISTTTDASGQVSFDLLWGMYTGYHPDTKTSFTFTVPDEAAVEWTACVNPVTPLPETPTFAAGQLTGTLQPAQVPAFTGDVTSEGASYALTIAADAVSNAKLANMAAKTIKANLTGSAANPTDATVTEMRNLLMQLDFATRAELVAWVAANTAIVGLVARAAGVSYLYTGSGTAISDMAGWVPNGEATDDHFNGDLSALRAYLDGLTNTEHGIVRGTLSYATPILSDADRSASVSGTTRMGNLNEPGSITEYTGTGISKTIASATNANPAVFTSTAHGFTAGERVWTKDIAGGTWAAALSGGPWLVAGVTTNTFTLTNDAGTAFNGTTLGTLTGGTIRNEGAMGGWVLGGSFMQDYSGLTMRTTQAVESIVTINAENYVDSTDFSGSITRFSGIQFAPKTNDVTDAQVIIENHKFATFDNCWWIRGANGTPAMRIGLDYAKSQLTLLKGASVHTMIEDAFIFSNIEIEHAELLTFENVQFDSTSYPVRLLYSGNGVASEVGVRAASFINDGGATGSGLAAVTQAATDITSPTLNFTSGWLFERGMYRDWPIGILMNGGWAKVQANNFRGREAGNIGIVIGENAVGENIGHENNFLQMLANSNQGLLDLRYKAVTITGATKGNPVVITCSGGHHFNAGDRVRITSVGGMTDINNKEFIVTSPDATTFQLYSVDDNGATSAAVNGAAYGTYTSGGSVTRPYHWHRQNVGGVMLALGHGSFVFDLALDQLATLASGINNLLTMTGVPFVGGFYEVVYSATINMLAVTGTVKFSVNIGSIGAPADLYSAFEHTGTGNQEVHHHFQKVIYIPGQTNSNGETVRLRIDAPGIIYARGKASGTLGQTFMQIRKVS